MGTTDASEKHMTVEEIMVAQSPTIDGWICPTCRYHEGGLGCAKRVFISVVGANMSGCSFYESETKCRHCGKMS